MDLKLKENGGGVYVLPDALQGYTVISVRKIRHLAPIDRGGYYSDPVCRVDFKKEDRAFTDRKSEFAQPVLPICRRCVSLILNPDGPEE